MTDCVIDINVLLGGSMDGVDTRPAPYRRSAPATELSNTSTLARRVYEPSTAVRFNEASRLSGGSFPLFTHVAPARDFDAFFFAGDRAVGVEAKIVPLSGILRGCVFRGEQSAFEARVRELETLTNTDNWDLEGGRAVPPHLWTLARWLYTTARDKAGTWIEPFISPSGDGTVHLTWLRNGGRLNLEICDGEWHVAVKVGQGAGYRNSEVLPEEALVQLRDFLA